MVKSSFELLSAVEFEVFDTKLNGSISTKDIFVNAIADIERNAFTDFG